MKIILKLAPPEVMALQEMTFPGVDLEATIHKAINDLYLKYQLDKAAAKTVGDMMNHEMEKRGL